MKSALSARYGGLLVEAVECDYSSFKHLMLLCPICKRSVYLVKPKAVETYDRKRRDGTFTTVAGFETEPYFAHHPEVDRSIADDCELRVRALTPAQKQAIKIQSRQQLLKKLHSHFWRILKTNFKMADHEAKLPTMRAVWLKASIRNEATSKRLYEILVNSLCDALARHKEVIKTELSHAIDRWYEESQVEELVPDDFKEILAVWRQKLDRQMQILIVAEMLDFLCQQRQRPILAELVEAGLYMFTLTRAIGLSRAKTLEDVVQISNLYAVVEADDYYAIDMISVAREMIGMDQYGFEAVLMFVRDDVVQCLAFTDWAGQFERLEKLEAEQKKNS